MALLSCLVSKKDSKEISRFRLKMSLISIEFECTPTRIENMRLGSVIFGLFIGGSMIASFSTFPELAVSRAEYDDNGDTKGNNLLKKSIF